MERAASFICLQQACSCVASAPSGPSVPARGLGRALRRIGSGAQAVEQRFDLRLRIAADLFQMA